MTVTIKDVALKAGVSPKTVSRVMNGEAHVRAAVREAVLRVVAELDYRPNAFARSLSSSRSYLLGIFFDDPASGYAASMQRGALAQCRAKGYHLVVEPLDLATAEWESELIASLGALRLDGAILTPPLCEHGPLLDRFDALQLPYVRVSPGEEGRRSGSVDMDELRAAQEMTAHLIALGHRDIGFVQGNPTHGASPKRLAGYLAAMREAGLPVLDGRVAEGDFSFRSGLAAGEAMLRDAARPTAIFASNDDMALGVSVAAMKHGISVPGALSIAGFDDAAPSRIAWPPITTIRQPVDEMAAAAVAMLVDPGYRTNASAEVYRRHLPYALIRRGSTAPPTG
ncbi:MAG: transcriptional regulator [Sphingomonas bacterium]|jgi:LacI family transcriptional regulator|nr:transcriptional regulator [Sphingomonas bacterium]